MDVMIHGSDNLGLEDSAGAEDCALRRCAYVPSTLRWGGPQLQGDRIGCRGGLRPWAWGRSPGDPRRRV